jgi:hypothetical protein
MATTTNYGWDTPDDTDLVKDGAAAIRTLGSSIDTTTKNLNPQTTTGALAYRSATANVNTALPLGTANQVLRVNSGGTAPEWATTADQTPLTTKGDLFGFDTADARIPIGTNGHILTADSTQSLGLKWAAPAGAGLTLVKSQVIGSAVSSVTVTAAFSATYDAYAIFLTGGTGSVDDENITLQLGSTTTGYYAAYIGAVISTAASTIAANNNTSNFTRAGIVATDGSQFSFEIINPNLAKRTYIKNGIYGGDTQVRYWAGYVDNTTQYTAFTVAPASGTLTGGTIFVYGYALS